MEYVTPVNGDPNDPTRAYVDGDPTLGQAGSIPSARFFNLLLAEARNLVEGAGLALDPNDDAQWLAAVRTMLVSARTSLHIENFTTVGTTQWVVPADVISVYVEVWGGGGGGSGGAGGSGGGGGYAARVASVTPGEVIDITVGQGGAAATYPSFGGNGGASSFGTYATATGGEGGNGGSGGGGGAFGGEINRSGGPGSDLNGTYPRAFGGNAGGGGGQGGTASNTVTGGLVPGGGGAAHDSAAANGARGEVIVRYWK